MSAAFERKADRSGPIPLVLVVDDDDDCRETISETLKDANYAVVEAADAEEALRFLLAEDTAEPRVIVLDIWLPGMSGHELIKLLRLHDRLSHIPLVLTSAGRPCGADTEVDTKWLAKPFDAEHLVAAVNEQSNSLTSRVTLRRPS